MQTSAARRIKPVIHCLLVALSSATFAADLELNRLTACPDVARILADANQLASSCTLPATQIERTVRDAVAGSDVKLCVMGSPPVASLSEFRCFQLIDSGAGAVTCYRPLSAGFISEYKAKFDSQFAAPTANYMEAAKRCSGTNGDTSRTIETTFPQTLIHVAQHQFGFNVQYGQTHPGTALVTHGFASTSPDIARNGPNAIEYVVFANGLVSGLAPRTALGNWRLRVDTSDNFAAPFLASLRNQGVDAYLASVDVSMMRAPLAPKLDKSSPLADDLAGMLVGLFEDKDFDEMSDDDFEAKTGKTKEQVGREMSRNIAFGARRLMDGKIPYFRLLMRTSGRQCMEHNGGAIGVYLLMLDGDPKTQADYGSISAIVVGFGECASWFGTRRDYLRELADQAKQAMLNDLSHR